MSKELKISVKAEIDPSSIKSMQSELQKLSGKDGRLKLEIDDTGIKKTISGLAPMLKQSKLEIDTSSAKTSIIEVNGELKKFQTINQKAMMDSKGSVTGYVKTMESVDKTLKRTVTYAKDFSEIGSTITQNLTKPVQEAQKILSSTQKNLNTELNSIAKGFQGIIAPENIRGIRELISALDTSNPQFKNDVKEIEKDIRQMGDTARTTAKDLNDSLKFEANVDKLSGDLEELTHKFRDVVRVEDAARIRGLIEDLNPKSVTLGTDISNITAEIRNLTQGSKEAHSAMKATFKFESDVGKLKDDLADVSKKFKDIVRPEDINRVNSMIKALNMKDVNVQGEIGKVRGEISKLTKDYTNIQREAKGATSVTEAFGQTLSKAAKSAAAWVSLTLAVRMFFREMKKGVTVVKEVDSAMVELKKVTNNTEKEYADFTRGAFETGRQLGRTGVEVINATADFARMGFELKDATGLAKEALLMLNVGDGIENLESATKSMIATLKGFGTEANQAVTEARRINDAYNEVANNFAVDTGALAEGVRRVSAVMRSSGNDLDQTIGLLAGGFEVIQDTRKVSSGLNIIAQRLKGISDEGKETVKLLPTLKKEFKEVAGISLEKQNGQMKSTYEILGEMARVLPTLRDHQRNFLMELSAGKRQAVVLEAILSNWENIDAAVLTAQKSMGSALVENQVYLDSIEGKMSVFKATMQEFWTTAINTESVKDLVDSGSHMVRVLTDIVANMGALQTGATVLTPLLGVKLLNSFTSILGVGSSLENVLFTIAPNLFSAKAASDLTATSFGVLSATTLGLKAALLLIPAALLMIKNAEEKRRRATEDSVKEFEKQEELAPILGGIADAYGDLANKQNRSTKETEVMLELKERMKKLSPELANVLDDESKSIDDQVSTVKQLSEEKLRLAEIEAKENVEKYAKGLDEKKARLRELVDATLDYTEALEKLEAKEGRTRKDYEEMSGLTQSIKANKKESKKLREEIERGDEAIARMNKTTKIQVGAMGEYYDEYGNLVDATGEVLENVRDINAEKLEGAKEGMLNAKFGTDEFIESLKDAIYYQKELDGLTSDSEGDLARDYSETLAKQYEDSSRHIELIEKAREEIKKDGRVSHETATKLARTERELHDIRGRSKKEAQEALKASEKEHKQRMETADKEIIAHANKNSLLYEQIEHAKGLSKTVRKGMAETAKAISENGKTIADMWGGMDSEVKSFIIDISGIDPQDEEDFRKLDEWFKESKEIKEYEFTVKGLDFVEKNIKSLGIEWKELSDDEKTLTARAIGIGLDIIPDFANKWKSLSEEEKQFLIEVLKKEAEDPGAFQKRWDALDPKVQKFIAQSVGIEDVDKATKETMSSWAEDPKVKIYVAEHEGLKDVRIEKHETDDIWEITLGDKTYRTNEEGAALARETIGKLQELWKGIPNTETKTKTTRYVEETIYKQSGKLPTSFGSGQRLPSISSVMTSRRWTGDDNFKGGLSYVGEKGRELLVYPDGSHDMTGSRAELRNLPRGTKIYNNQDTEAIMSGKKIPEFERSDKRVTGSSNTPGFAKGNTKVKGNPMPPNATSAQARASALAKANAKTAATKSATKAIKEQYKAEVDLYEGVNIQIEKQNNLIKKNALLQDRAKDGTFGKIRLIQEQIKLEKQHQTLLNNKINIAIRERNQQEALLKKSGFKFKGSGNSKEITNLQNIKGKSEQVEEAFNKFNELQFKTIPGLQVEIMEMANAIQSALSAGFTNQMRLDNRVKENDHLIAINKINQEREKDVNKRVLLMKEEIKLIEHKAYLSRGQVKIYQAEREEIETILRKQGFIFAGRDGGRKITNPQKLKGQVKEIEELFNRYNELQIDVIPNLVIDSEGFKDNVDKIKDSINDALIDSKFEESDKEIEDYNYTIEMSRHNRATNQRKDPYWQVKTRETELEALEGRYNVEYSKGWDYLNEADKYKKDSEQYKKLKAKSDEYFRASRASELEIAQLKEDLHKARLQHIDEEVDTYREKQEELRYQLDLLDEDSLDERARLTSKIVDEEVKVRNAMKNTLESLKEQLEVTLYNTDEWHVINDSVKEYEKKVRESNLELKKMKDNVESIAKEQAKVSFDKTLEGIESSLFNGKTESEAREDFEHKLYLEGKYIEGAEKELEIARLKNYAMREELTLTKEQNSILNGNGKIERASLDKMSKQLDIQRLQNKLANERNQKNIRQLKKNEDGTFGFEFVADAKVIQETEDELAQKKVDLIKWERDYQNDQDRKSLEDKSSYLSKLDDILKKSLDGEYKTASEFYQAMEKLNIDFMSRIDDAGYLDVWEDMVKNMSPLLDNLGLIFRDLLATVNDSFKEQVTSSKEQWDKLKSELSIDTVSTHKINIEAILDVEDSAIEDANSGLSVEKAPDKNLLSKQYEILSQKLKTLVPNIPDFLSGINDINFKKILPVTSNVYVKDNNSNSSGDTGVAKQVFNIDKLEFPNVTNSKEIEESIRNLSTFATQWANKK